MVCKQEGKAYDGFALSPFSNNADRPSRHSRSIVPGGFVSLVKAITKV